VSSKNGLITSFEAQLKEKDKVTELETILKSQIEEMDRKVQEQVNKVTEIEKLYTELEKELEDKDSGMAQVEMKKRMESQIEEKDRKQQNQMNFFPYLWECACC
jgi:predicted nuclease with TOPRIM domain